MKTLIILYRIGTLDFKKFVDATILYYDIDFVEGREENVKEILERSRHPEIIENELANTKHKYKY